MSAVSEEETLAALTCRGNNMYFIIFMACFLSSSVNIGRVKLEAHGPDLVHRFLVPPPPPGLKQGVLLSFNKSMCSLGVYYNSHNAF